MALPAKILLEVVTPMGLLLREEVDELIAPGEDGYFGVRPGHTPLLATLGNGVLSYRAGGQWLRLTSFGGFCEVLPDRVNVLADIGERADEIDRTRAEKARDNALARMKAIRDEAGYQEAHVAYVRAVTRLTAVERKPS